MLGMAPHQLRDERYRRRIKASCGPGNKILYSPQDLRDYLLSRRWDADKSAPRSSTRARLESDS